MPDHVKKILNRAYLDDKPYNDIVLHLEREMRLNGLGAPDETTLVPLNTVDAVVTEDKKGTTTERLMFSLWKIRALQSTMPSPPQRKVLRHKDEYRWTHTNWGAKPKCDNCGNMHKTKNCWDGANAANDPRKKKREFTIPTNKINEQPVSTPSSQPKNWNRRAYDLGKK